MRLKKLAVAATLATMTIVGVPSPAHAGGFFQTLSNLNLRTCQYLNEPVCLPIKIVIPNTYWVYLNCWAYGTPVNGDSIWYNTSYQNQSGMVAGYYMATGADPNPAVSRCP